MQYVIASFICVQLAEMTPICMKW